MSADSRHRITDAFSTVFAVSAGGCITVLLFALWAFPVAILNGWALSIMWRWFLVPLGAPLLSIPRAIGITMTVRVVLPGENLMDLMNEEQKKKLLPMWLFRSFSSPLIAIALGWLVKQWLN